MPIGNLNRQESSAKRENYRPPWVKEKGSNDPPAWMQKRLKPVDTPAKAAAAVEEEAPVTKPALKRE